MRKRLAGGEPEKPLVLFISRLSVEKRVDWLLPVVKKIPGIRLAIVGDGPDRGRLEELFAGTPTVFTGYLQGAELAAAYASGDIFAFTGAEETFGNVVAEAMASGLAVVAPRSGGVVDLVEDGVTGFLYTPENDARFLARVKELTGDLPQARKMGEAGKEKIRRYAWETTLDNLLDVYTKLIEKSKSKPKPKKKKPLLARRKKSKKPRS
jgi:glycosyltransferase involved in cell wall biosynthesis